MNSEAILIEAPVLDAAFLLELLRGDEAALARVPFAALEAICADVRQIKDAAAAGDMQRAAEHAHRIKGTSGTIRHAELFELAGRIQTEAFDEQAVLDPVVMQALHASIFRLGPAIDALLCATGTARTD